LSSLFDRTLRRGAFRCFCKTECAMHRPALPASRFLLGLTLAPLAAAAQAPTPSQLPDQVVTATRVPTSLERLPAAVTVIDRATIDQRGYTTLAEALAAVPGIAVVPSGGAGQQTSVFMRGTNSRHVLVLLDGQPIADPSEPNGAFNFGDDSLADIERIEVVRGPASVYYGSGAIGGVINLITRRAPRDRAFAPFGEVAAGSSRTVQGFAGAGGTLRSQLGLFDYAATLQSASTRGSNALAGRLATNRGEDDGGRLAGLTTRLGYEPAANTRFEALVRRRETRIGIDDRPDAALDDPNAQGLNMRTNLRLSGTTTLFSGLWTTGLAIGHNRDDRKFSNDPDAENVGKLNSDFEGRRTLLEFTNTLRPDLGAPTDDTAFVFGVQRNFDAARSRLTDIGAFGTFRSDTDADTGSTGFYLGGQTRLFGMLDLTGGVRQDEDDDFGGATTWNLGAVLAVPGLPLPVRLRASTGTSFKAPSLEQLYFTSFGFGVVSRGNPNLRPERGRSWEAGIEADLPVPGLRRATLGVTYFESRVRNQIASVFLPDFSSTYRNLDRLDVEGIETTVQLAVADWLEVQANYTVLDARETRNRTLRAQRRQQHQGSIALGITPMPRLSVAPEIVFNGNQNDPVLYADSGAGNFRGGLTKGATLVNLTVTYAVQEGLAVFLRGRNLTDQAYEPANSFQITGRTVLAGVRANW
jgi:vitamin B12 transporter